MPSYARLLTLVKSVCPFLWAARAVDFTSYVVAELSQPTSCPTTLAKAFLRPAVRRTAALKHELLRRLKRLSRFLRKEQVDPLALDAARVSDAGRLGRLVGALTVAVT